MDFKLVIKKIIITSIFFSCSWLIDDFSFYITNKNCNLSSNQTLLFSDVHIFGDYTGTWVVKFESQRYMQKMFKYILKTQIKIHLGDSLHEGFFNYTTKARFEKYINTFNFIFGNDVLQLAGNHDIGNTPSESSLHNYITFISELNYIKDNFCFLNTMLKLNETFIDSLPNNCICFLHYPDFNRTLLNTKCKHYFVGHTHLFEDQFNIKQTILPTFNPFQTDYQTGYVLTDFENYKLCSGINYLFIPFLTSINISLLFFSLHKPQMYYALFDFSEFHYFCIEYVTIILNLILFVLSFSTSIGEIYAIWFYLYLILMTVFIIIDSKKYKLIATLLIVIIYVGSILFSLGIFINFIQTDTWKNQDY